MSQPPALQAHAQQPGRHGPAPPAGACRLSVVTMVYRSLPFLPEFLRQMGEAIAATGIADYEILFVNDGSPDESLAYLMEAHRADHRIRVLELSRNFGHHRAALAGLHYARGELVFVIDCDLEVAPSVLPEFLKTMRQTEADVVYGVQERRRGGWVARVGGGLFWKLFNRLSDTKVPESVTSERLMKRPYVDALLSLGDRNIFLAGMMYWTGFRQVAVKVATRSREGGSSYSLRRRVSLLIEAITSFSAVPLKLMLGFGLALTAAAVAFACFILVRKLLDPSSLLAGFTTLSLLIIGMGGVIITLMGVLGLYISRIFVQTQARPNFIVRDYFGPADPQ
jgi:putative glycosyltransferase